MKQQRNCLKIFQKGTRLQIFSTSSGGGTRKSEEKRWNYLEVVNGGSILQLFDYLAQFDYFHAWELQTNKNVVVVIICYDVFGISCYSTINKLVIVRVVYNDFKAIKRRNKFCIGIVDNNINSQPGKIMVCLSFKNLFVFFQDFIGHTQMIATV